MPRYFALRWSVVLLICLIAGLAIAFALHSRPGPGTLVVTIDHDTLPADGYAQARAHARASSGRELPGVTWRLENGRGLVDLEQHASDAQLRAGVTPGEVALTAFAPGFKPTRVEIKLDFDPTDQFGDGTPDFLRLQAAEDRIAFRWLSETPRRTVRC